MIRLLVEEAVMFCRCRTTLNASDVRFVISTSPHAPIPRSGLFPGTIADFQSEQGISRHPLSPGTGGNRLGDKPAKVTDTMALSHHSRSRLTRQQSAMPELITAG